MKLEEIKKNMDVKVIKVVEQPCEEKYIGREGEVVEITPNVPYPITVDFGYEEVGLFKPEELKEV